MIEKLIAHLVVFALLFATYMMLLRKTGAFGLNRLILLSIPIISAVLPFIQMDVSETTMQSSVILPEIQTGLKTVAASTLSNGQDISLIWLIGAMMFTGFFIPRLILSFKKSKTESGYSFLYRFYVNKDLDLPLSKAIESHEKVHVDKGHSYDILFLELARIILWFNPMIHWLIKEARINHEYEADAIASREHTQYLKMLVSQHFKVDHKLLGHSFGKSNLKKRVIMIQKQKKRSFGRYIMFAGLSLMSFVMISWNVHVSDLTSAPKDTLKVGEVDKMPEYKGGYDALTAYMQKSIEYPEQAKKDNVEGKVVVAFTVTETGKVTKVHVEKSDNDVFNASALKVVKSMPNWIPAEKDGKKVSAKMMLPIVYKL